MKRNLKSLKRLSEEIENKIVEKERSNKSIAKLLKSDFASRRKELKVAYKESTSDPGQLEAIEDWSFLESKNWE